MCPAFLCVPLFYATLTQYGYDQLNRLISTTATRRFGQNVDVNPNVAGIQPDVASTVFAVDGQIDYETATTAGGTVTTEHLYDTQGRPTVVDYFVDNNANHMDDPGDTPLSLTENTYNNDGTRKNETSNDAQGNFTTESWTYDGDGRVASETFDGFDDQGNPLNYTDTFTYDMAGNRSTLTHTDRTPGGPGSAGASFVITDSYDGDDRLVSEAKDVGGTSDTADDTDTVYGYSGTDQSTQTVHRGLTAAGTVTQTTNYTYDVTGAMTGVSITDNTTSTTTSVSYAYDANGVRVERIENGVRTVYLIDPDNPTGYTQVLEEGADTNNNHRLDAADVQQAYTIGTRVLTQATASQVLKLLSDAHGSTRAVLDAGASTLNAAAVLQHYVYSAFGSDLGLPSSPLTDLRYAGQMIDPLTGLSYNRARWYDPATGRFTQFDSYTGDPQDPITLNKYLYGDGNPITNSDPSGEFSLGEILTVTGIDQIVEKAQSAYKGEQTSVRAARMLVRLALIESGIVSFTIDGLTQVQRGFLLGYDVYETYVFEKKKYQTKFEEAKLPTRAEKVVKYIASLAQTAGNDTGDLPTFGRGFLPPGAKGKVKYLTVIPYTGTRSKDYVVAKFAALAEDAAEIILELSKGKGDWIDAVYDAAREEITGNGKFKGRTWHHHEVLGVMESIRTSIHSRKGHTGAVPLWEVVNDTKYA